MKELDFYAITDGVDELPVENQVQQLFDDGIFGYNLFNATPVYNNSKLIGFILTIEERT